MDVVPVPDVIVLPPGVALRMLHQRRGDRFEHDVVERDLALIAGRGVEGLARLGHPFHVHLAREVEGRDRADRLNEALGDGLADLGKGSVLERRTVGRSDGRTGRSRRAGRRGRGALQVALDDPAFRAAAADTGQVDSTLRSDLPREGRGFDAFSRRTRRGRRSRRGRFGGLGLAGLRIRRRLLVFLLRRLCRRLLRGLFGGGGRLFLGLRGGGRRGAIARHRLALLADPPDRGGYRHRRAGRHELLQQHPRTPGHQLHHGLIGFDLGQDITRRDRVAFVLLPLDEAPFFHRRRERLHHDLSRHGRALSSPRRRFWPSRPWPPSRAAGCTASGHPRR